jgi:hypothetical protein
MGNVSRMIDNIHEQERKHLEDLMVDADLFAKHSMNETGGVPPTLFIHGANGKTLLSPDDFSGERAKDEFSETARLMCVAQDADATVFLSEAWMRQAVPGEEPDASKLPSQCPDRQEMLIMMGETRGCCQQRMLPMERSEDGKFLGFGQEQKMEADRVEGRLANFIPAEYPDGREREMASEALAERGVEMEEQERERRMERRM